jgi:hypothetical protein
MGPDERMSCGRLGIPVLSHPHLTTCQEPLVKHNTTLRSFFIKRQGKKEFLRYPLINQLRDISET